VAELPPRSAASGSGRPDRDPAPDADHVATDELVAVVVGVLWLADALVVGAPSRPETVSAIAAVVGAALLSRRSQMPLVVTTGIWVVLMLQTALGVDADASVMPAVAIGLAMYALGRWERDDRAITGLLGAVMAAYAMVLAMPAPQVGDYVFASVAFLAPFLGGHVVRRLTHDDEGHDAGRRLRARASGGGVAWQHQLIAADGYRALRAELERLADRRGAARALAVAERLRRVSGVADPSAEEPMLPGVAELADLVHEARLAGADVSWRETGELTDPAADVGVALHRILEEALANVLEHADPPRATVELRWEPDVVVLEVLDEGAPVRGALGRGQGLLAMRERAQACGGSFYAGRRESGGFRIRVRMPLDGAELDEDPGQAAALATTRTAPRPSAATTSPSRS